MIDHVPKHILDSREEYLDKHTGLRVTRNVYGKDGEVVRTPDGSPVVTVEDGWDYRKPGDGIGTVVRDGYTVVVKRAIDPRSGELTVIAHKAIRTDVLRSLNPEKVEVVRDARELGGAATVLAELSTEDSERLTRIKQQLVDMKDSLRGALDDVQKYPFRSEAKRVSDMIYTIVQNNPDLSISDTLLDIRHELWAAGTSAVGGDYQREKSIRSQAQDACNSLTEILSQL